MEQLAQTSKYQGLEDGPVWAEEASGDNGLPFDRRPLACTNGDLLAVFKRCLISVRLPEGRPIQVHAQFLGSTPEGHVFNLNGIKRSSDGQLLNPITNEPMMLPHDPMVTIPEAEIARLNRDRADRMVCIWPELESKKGGKNGTRGQ